MSGDHQPKTDDQQTDPTSEPEQTARSSADDKTVPLSELVKHRQAAAEAKKAKEDSEAKIKELEARLADAEKRKSDDSTQPEPSTPEQPAKPEPTVDPSKLSKLDDVLRKDAIRDLKDEHELTFKQAEKVHDLMEKMPDLDFDEAKAIAASRYVDVFSDDGRSPGGFQPNVHAAGRPRPGSQPGPQDESDTPKRLEFIQKAGKTNKDAAKAVFNNLVGSIAAAQVGMKGHQRIKLPRT